MTQFTPRASTNQSPIARHAGIPRTISELMTLLRVWQHRARSRGELATLTTERLQDLGLSTEDAAREASKPFWR